VKRERPLKLHEHPGLAYRARFLTNMATETLLEWLATPAQRSTRTLRALITAEVCYRVSRRTLKPAFHVAYPDGEINKRVWADVFGPRAPMPPGFGAASQAFPHDRAWADMN
jgi:hypothetical protein